MTHKFVAYYRVSTARQGDSGLGLEAQRQAVLDYLNGGSWELSAEYVEVESGKTEDRPKLVEALKECRRRNATLVIAKLDRLSRNAAFLLTLQAEGVRFVAVDQPEANELTVGILAVVAQAERKAISERTRAALAAAKARGVKLGGLRHDLSAYAKQANAKAQKVRAEKADRFAQDMADVIQDIQNAGVTSLCGIAKELNARGFKTRRGGQWQATSVKRIMDRL
ncbi:resolvase [Rhodothalassium salexigens]|uniref:recombinase family protein n=1 Tax=Rhodothalassium salexigens TaxID=1086 RepID=UPI0019114982|nr:recombinase family protein [Rhodothalassium salexigens]MBK5912333.1 resolvase [Rhodothalassium salexigens]